MARPANPKTTEITSAGLVALLDAKAFADSIDGYRFYAASIIGDEIEAVTAQKKGGTETKTFDAELRRIVEESRKPAKSTPSLVA